MEKPVPLSLMLTDYLDEDIKIVLWRQVLYKTFGTYIWMTPFQNLHPFQKLRNVTYGLKRAAGGIIWN